MTVRLNTTTICRPQYNNFVVQWSVDRAWDVLYCEQVLMEVASAHEDILLPIFLNLTYEEVCVK